MHPWQPGPSPTLETCCLPSLNKKMFLNFFFRVFFHCYLAENFKTGKFSIVFSLILPAPHGVWTLFYFSLKFLLCPATAYTHFLFLLYKILVRIRNVNLSKFTQTLNSRHAWWKPTASLWKLADGLLFLQSVCVVLEWIQLHRPSCYIWLYYIVLLGCDVSRKYSGNNNDALYQSC